MSTIDTSCLVSCSSSMQEVQTNLVFLPDERAEKIKSVALGVIVGLLCFTLVAGVMYALQKHVPGFRVSQDAIKIFHLFSNVHPILDVFWRAVWRGVVVLAGPIIEEYLFRGLLFDGVKKCQQKSEDSTINKIIRIAVVSLIFGLCHLSPFQNALSNLVIVGMTTIIGVALGALKEYRKDLLSPTTAHVIYNLSATL